MQKAEEDATEKAAQTDLLSQAAEQARTVVTALLMPMAEDDEEYHIEVIQPWQILCQGCFSVPGIFIYSSQARRPPT